MTGPRVLTEDLGGSPLSRAARRGELAQWYGDRVRGEAAWRQRAEAVAREFASTPWDARLAGAFAASGPAAERLRRVAASGGVVVTTGQQPGLFGGPLMTFAKALTALALADALERTGVAAAPVFWAATDDADFEEGNWTRIAVFGGVETLRLTSRPPAGTPMSRAPLGDISDLFRALTDACGSAADPAVLEATGAAYAREATVGGAYVDLLRRVLQPLGIAVLDACHDDVRRASGDLLRRALERADAVASALAERDAAIRAARFTPQVEEVPGLSLVFTMAEGAKRRLTIAEATDAARRTRPEELIPNVLLRPVVERAILPTVTYVGGPGEIAYFAQVGAVAEALDASRPRVVPRWSTTIVEPRVQRILDRLGASSDDVRDPHGLETRLARAALPPPVADALRALRADVERGTADLELADDDTLVPPAVIQGVRRAVLHRLERLERRYTAAVKRREAEVMRDVATVRASLYPDGLRQERALSFVPLLARYGAPLLDEMRAAAAGHAASIVDLVAAPALGASGPLPSGA